MNLVEILKNKQNELRCLNDELKKVELYRSELDSQMLKAAGAVDMIKHLMALEKTEKDKKPDPPETQKQNEITT